MNQTKITKGGRISIPTQLYNQYLREYQEANRILKTQRKKGRSSETITFRQSDLSKFERRKDLIRYIKTTHKIVTGKYFKEQASIYRRNLLSAMLTNSGINVTVVPTAFTLGSYDLATKNRNLYYLTRVISTLTSEQITELERKSKINLIGYQYQPEETQGEHLEYIKDLLNTPKSKGGIFDEKNYYSDVLIPYMRKQLEK